MDKRSRRASDRTIAIICAAAVAGMVGVAFAAVPFYRAFCQATGFDGTPRRALANASGADSAHGRRLTVRFDTNVRGLPWIFTPLKTHETVVIGKTSMAYFKVRNTSDRALTGRAVYNIAPQSGAAYFLKLQCFCFSDQTIPAGVEKTFPVVFYVDPKFATDPDTSPLTELTLSYTFYPVKADGSIGAAG